MSHVKEKLWTKNFITWADRSSPCTIEWPIRLRLETKKVMEMGMFFCD